MEVPAKGNKYSILYKIVPQWSYAESALFLYILPKLLYSPDNFCTRPLVDFLRRLADRGQ